MLSGDNSFDFSSGKNFTCGFSKAILTPTDVKEQKYFIAGYDSNNKAEDVLDDMFARVFFIDDNKGNGGVIFCSIDAVGMSRKDINDIRKASLIGASASMFFPFIGRAVSSFTNTHNNHFLNMIQQLNTDWAMKKMISDNYKEIHDHNHLSMYYDMFRKGGVDNIRLRKSLNTLKASVDENSTFATPEYIEDDIQLMENVYTAYKDDQFAKNLAANGIKKYSPEYKTAVINYGRAL
jgi:hypothetical protein